MRVLRKTVFLALTALILLAELGCGDQYRPVANPIVQPGGQPQITHYAWVVNYNPNGNGSTTMIDVSGDTNLSVTPMGVGSIAEAFPTNSLSLYVANYGNDSVSQYLPTLSGAVTTISLFAGSHPIALTSTQNGFMYVLNSGANSACQNSGSISTITASTLSVSSTVCVGVNPIAMAQAPGTNYIYILNQGDSNTPASISAFNPALSTVVGTITPQNGLGLNPVSIATNAQGWVFVVTQGDGVNPGTLDLIPGGYWYIAGTVPLGVKPTASFVDPNRNRLYVTNNGDNTVTVFDAASANTANSPIMNTLAVAPVGSQPVAVTALLDGSNFFVANAGDNTVTVVSQNSFSPLTSVALPSGANPLFIASDPTSQKVYVSNEGTFNTSIIQTSNNTITQNISAPTQVSGCTSSCAMQTPMGIVTY